MNRIAEGEAIEAADEARRFCDFMGGNRFRRREYRALAVRAVTLGVPAGGRVLDVGTGPGFVALEVARLLRGRDCAVVGMDLSLAMLALAAENAAREGLAEGLVWREGDAKAMPFGDDEFDLLVCNDSLHHWANPLPVFDEMARVLKPGGALMVHDSRRLGREPARLLARLIGWTIPADFRVHYWASLRSSYTVDELRAVLAQSRLQGWRLEQNVMDLTVVMGGAA